MQMYHSSVDTFVISRRAQVIETSVTANNNSPIQE